MADSVISSGHGKYVSGAALYINEVDEARRVVNKVTDLLNKAGHETIKYHDNVSRTQRDNINQIVRSHNSKKRKQDISVHFNASKKMNDPKGVEVLYVSSSGKALAEKVVNAIAKASGLKNRGAKKRTDLGFLKGTHKPAILIEVCFVDSKADVDIYKKKFNEICKAIAESLSGKKIAAPSQKTSTSKSNDTVYQVQIGAYSDKKNAEIQAEKARKAGFNVYINPKK